MPHRIPVIENFPLGLGGFRLLGRGRGGDRLGTMRVPIASGGTGNHAGSQKDQTVRTPHGASPGILIAGPCPTKGRDWRVVLGREQALTPAARLH